MKITLWQSGGVAGALRSASIEEGDVEEQSMERFRELLREYSGTQPSADARMYRLKIEDGDAHEDFTVDESNATPELRALLSSLAAKATFVKRK